MPRAGCWIAIVVLLISALSGPVRADSQAGHATPATLTVDDDAAPLAVTDDPAFGWVMVDNDLGARQTAYQIVVSDAAHPDTAVGDTGEVHSDQQSYVHVPGLAAKLQPDHAYAWTVRTWDDTDQVTDYATRAHFDTGLADRDWNVSWIRRPGAERAGLEDYSLFRKDVTVTNSPVVRARVYASAGQQYQLRVNGTRLAQGPSYAYPDEQYYETTDVTGAIKAGASNAFGFVTFWGQPSQGRPASVPALIAHITIDHADGTRQVVTTDTTWRTHEGMWIQGPPRNDEGDFVEHIDMRKEPLGWDQVAVPSSWTPPAMLGTHPVAPFTHLFAARTHVIEQRVKPVKVTHYPGAVTVADFGAVISAIPVAQVRRTVAGTPVLLVGGYELDPNGHVSRTHGTQDTNMTWQFDERAGVQELRPFGYLAFRYLEFDGPSDTLELAIDARHAALPDENAAAFETSNPTLNAVWNLARHSALYDVQQQFVDTPTREKGPFLGDSYDVSQATMAAFRERNLTYQGLRDFARSQKRYWPDGRVNVVYPNGDGKRDIPDGTQTYPEWVWQYYLASGNRDALAALYPVVAKVTDYVARAINPATGLVTDLPGGGSDYLHGAVDWPPWMRYGYDMDTSARTMMNVLAVDDFQRAAAMAHALGKPAAEVKAQQDRADRVALAINKRLARPDGVYIDGLKANGSQSTHASQQANAWALAYGIVPAGRMKTVTDHIVSLGNAMGVPYFRVLLDALHAAGRDDAVIDALTDAKRPGYAQILKAGATFTWESWTAPQVGDSESHGWGAAVLSALQNDVLGVTATQPGGAAFDVRIPESKLAHAAGVVATQRGPLKVSWTRNGNSTTIDVTVPTNATTTVHIRATDVGAVSEARHPVDGRVGIQSATPTGDGVVTVVLGSGSYSLANTPPTLAAETESSSSSSSTTVALVGFGALILVGVGVGMAIALRKRNKVSGE